MIYKAYSYDADKLLSLPETGMGYQIIEGKLYSSQIVRKFVVYNCELVVDLDNDFVANKRMIVAKSPATILNESKSWLILSDSIRLIPRKETVETRYLSESKKTNKKRHSGGEGATENPKENADGTEIFVRLSSHENDIRIDFEKKKLNNGAYTTTHKDYLDCVLSDDDPIDRYALPYDDEIKWSFYIQPKAFDIMQRGIVQPAFGHDGGGIEAFFEKGTTENTLFDIKPYGK